MEMHMPVVVVQPEQMVLVVEVEEAQLEMVHLVEMHRVLQVVLREQITLVMEAVEQQMVVMA